jgi:ribosomal-protein-alanine N-acetyltransferase
MIISERLLLRIFVLSDWEALHALYMKPETVKYNPSGYPPNELFTRNLIAEWARQASLPQRSNYTLFIAERFTQHFVGLISLDLGKPKYRNAEIWFKLHPNQWGLGYATEALKAVLKFGFEVIDLHRIEGGCSTANKASYKVRHGTRRGPEAALAS